jgi:hypothetical protein
MPKHLGWLHRHHTDAFLRRLPGRLRQRTDHLHSLVDAALRLVITRDLNQRLTRLHPGMFSFLLHDVRHLQLRLLPRLAAAVQELNLLMYRVVLLSLQRRQFRVRDLQA